MCCLVGAVPVCLPACLPLSALSAFASVLAGATLFVDAPSARILASATYGLSSLQRTFAVANVIELETASRDDQSDKEAAHDTDETTTTTTTTTTTNEPGVESASGWKEYLPLDLSHAQTNDADVMQIAQSTAPSEQARSDAHKSDGWDWNDDDEEEDEEDSTPPPSSSASRLQSQSVAPAQPLGGSGKACFIAHGPLTSDVVSHMSTLLTRSRCAPSAFHVNPVPVPWAEVHILTSTSSGVGADSYVHIAQTMGKMVQNGSSSPDVTVRVHHLPISHLLIQPSTFLTPLAVDAAGTALATYPPALHVSGTHPPSRPSPPATIKSESVAPTAASASPSAAAVPASSSSSLLSSFSISSITKKLNDHIQEAEQIAMQDPAAAIEEDTPSSGASFLTSSLAAALARTLFSMRLQPDVFSIGHRTAELAKDTIEKLQEIKHADTTASDLSPMSRTGPHVGSSASPVWKSASLLLVERSLDLISVAKHHTTVSVRDRLNDHVAEEIGDSLHTPPDDVRSLAEIAQELMQSHTGVEDGTQAAMGERAAQAAHPIANETNTCTEDVREQLFGATSDSATGSPMLAHARSALFPDEPSPASLALLDAIAAIHTDAGASTNKAVLVVVLHHLNLMCSACGLPTHSLAASTNAGQIAATIRNSLEHISRAHPHAHMQHREFFSTVSGLLRSFSPAIVGGATKSLYDRIVAFEQLLMMQFVTDTSSLASASSHERQEERTRSLQGLVRMTVDFVRGINDEASGGSHQHRAKTESRLSLVDVMRITIYLFSLRFIPESASRPLQEVVMECIDSASPLDRSWLTRTCGWSERDHSRTAQLVDAFFRLLRGASLARSELTASDLVDLTSPLETDDEGISRELHPFVVRLLNRIQHPTCLLDDIDHRAFEEARQTDDSNTTQNESALPRDSPSSESAPPAAAAAHSGWSFFDSLASVVSSVAKSTTAPLRGLGFSSVARPDQRACIVLFVVGGVTHAEIAAIRRLWRAWIEREVAEERADGGTGAIAESRRLLIGSTHIANAQELVRQLLAQAAELLDSDGSTA